MIDFPDSATFAAMFADRRFAATVAICALAGAVRGFSGFGSALIYVPLVSAVYGPRVAAASMLLIDFIPGVVFALGAWRQAVWREILPMAAAAILAAQFGTLILLYVDPTILRWSISIVIGALLIVLASGWRYHGKPLVGHTIGVGLVAGLMGGAVQISGPPVILYWLGSMHETAVVRANFISYFSVFAAAATATYAIHGLLTPLAIALAIVLTPLYVVSSWIGARFFGHSSDIAYRRIAYVIIAVAAIGGAPIFDQIGR